MEVTRSESRFILDDGLGGNISYDEALISSRYIKQDLLDFGFLMLIKSVSGRQLKLLFGWGICGTQSRVSYK